MVNNGKMTNDKDHMRLLSMRAFDSAARKLSGAIVAGVDEAGRGPLAGPVVSAAIILPEDYSPEGLNDSKQLTASKRELLFANLTRDAVAWGAGLCGPVDIDEINILNATIKSMELAIGALAPQPDYLLIDALYLKNVPIDQKAIIKGDALSLSIAAASVLAKVIRDDIMRAYDREYPEYGFSRHKGYGTKEHIQSIRDHGVCPIHRKTFCHFG
jgi:ribonuclease HII